MKKLFVLLALFAVLQIGLAEEVTYDGSEAPEYNDSNLTVPIANDTNETNGLVLPNITLPEVNLSNISINLTDAGDKLRNATTTGVSTLDQVTGFLYDASPFLLLIIGIALILLSGFGKTIGIILIVLALIRILFIIL